MTEQDFIQGMWTKARELETLEAEISAARARSRRLRLAGLGQAALVILTLAVLLLAVPLLAGGPPGLPGLPVLIPVLFAALVAAYSLDASSFSDNNTSSEGAAYHGNT